MEKKFFYCIKILNNSDIVNYGTCQVVFYLTHRDTKIGENVHFPHIRTQPTHKIWDWSKVTAIKIVMWNDSMAVVADSSLNTINEHFWSLDFKIIVVCLPRRIACSSVTRSKYGSCCYGLCSHFQLSSQVAWLMAPESAVEWTNEIRACTTPSDVQSYRRAPPSAYEETQSRSFSVGQWPLHSSPLATRLLGPQTVSL